MGIYLNPGFNNFNEDKQLINFVDKSMIVKQLNYGMKIKNKSFSAPCCWIGIRKNI